MKDINIIITGVGGQGVVSAGTIIGNAALKNGLKVVMSEIHGMAQRGGIVSVDLRIGDVYGPIIPDGMADLIIGFESMETLRALKRASMDTIVIMNTERIVPFTVNVGDFEYPKIEKIVEKIGGKNIIGIDALDIAKRAGNVLSVNVVMVGAAYSTGILPLKEEDIEKSIMDHFPKNTWESNLKAFRMGMEQYRILREAYL